MYPTGPVGEGGYQREALSRPCRRQQVHLSDTAQNTRDCAHRPQTLRIARDGLSKLAPITQKNRLAKLSAIFRRAVKLRYMAEIHDADALKALAQRVIRLTRPERTILDPKDLRTLIDAANPNLKAALLLGLNCAYINCDVCALTVEKASEAVASGWLGGRRNKTGVTRLAMLWPETKQAIQSVLDSHPGTKAELFLNDRGRPWVAKQTNTIARELRTLVEEIGIPLTFARLRHYFQTIGEERTLDLVAVRHCMGHADRTISQVYRDRVLKGRIENVCNAVRTWYLSGVETKKPLRRMASCYAASGTRRKPKLQGPRPENRLWQTS